MLADVVEGGASEGESDGGVGPLEESFVGESGLVISIGVGLSPWLEGAPSPLGIFSMMADSSSSDVCRRGDAGLSRAVGLCAVVYTKPVAIGRDDIEIQIDSDTPQK